MEAYVFDWLNLLVRWLHVTAGIAWIGSSFYFIALDLHLRRPKEETPGEGIAGEVWEIHGGGFYRVEKFKVAPRELPSTLHWFKWEAYTTWLSGFGLLVVLYYFNAGTYLVDRSVRDLQPLAAVAISIGLLAVGWLVYDQLCRRLEGNDRLLAALIVAVIVLAAYGTTQVFSGRGAYINVGAMLGTWMAANVFFVIIPGQRDLVAAKKAGRAPDPIHGIRGKQRSVHNNYFTLPVVFAMLSNHFPMTYGHAQNWLVLLALMALGAWVQHFFNLLHHGRTVLWIPVSAAAGVVALAVLLAPRPQPTVSSGAGAVSLAQVQPIIQQRCVPCHSATPTQAGFTAAPNGVAFDTQQQIEARAQQIYQRSSVTRDMPLGNVTSMTDQERQLISDWATSTR